LKKCQQPRKNTIFHNIPEKLVDDEEAKYIAREILKIKPNKEIALRV